MTYVDLFGQRQRLELGDRRSALDGVLGRQRIGGVGRDRVRRHRDARALQGLDEGRAGERRGVVEHVDLERRVGVGGDRAGDRQLPVAGRLGSASLGLAAGFDRLDVD